ncbi:methyl-accepting chemotaxis protein [Bosea vaviloviae]|uniref:methyl-accepting chemotaxis protein n=1 Tax=Bosea vaviloviae TaxID=1526658 RepID=UPI0018D0907D|nr:methyl-accepting chemotaxis protein [Bosea vaviloviae]
MALLMLPIGHLTLLFVQQVRKDVAFSSLEIEGAKVLNPLWGALSISTSPNPDASALKAAVDMTSAVRVAAVELKASEAIAAFITALAAPNAAAKAWDAGQTAIQKIADGSNLTLDPDVDSYYMMDVVAVRLPELVIAKAALETALLPYLAGSARASVSAHDALVEAATRFDIALAAARGSLKSGIAGNPDGSLGKSLLPIMDRFGVASGRVSQLVGDLRLAIAKDGPSLVKKIEFDGAALAFSGSAQDLWQAVQAELIRLVTVRIDGVQNKALRDLVIAAFGALLAIGVALVFVRTIRNPIADIIAALRRFQLNDYSGSVPHLALRNEIGEIARAVDRGKAESERTALTVAAMNQSPTMLMITDPDERITFISASLAAFLMRLEPTFRAAEPDFSVETMMGQHIDCYRGNGNLSRTLLIDNGDVRKVRYDIAAETIMVDMAYICAKDGSRIGHTLIWRNVTAELLGEAEVASVVSAAQQGDFSARLPLDNKEGFVREIAAGLNNVSALVEKATGEFADVMDSVARADLTRSVSGDYAGVLGSLKSSINATVGHLASTVKTIQVTSADVGLAAREINMGADDLSKRTEEQASSLEETAATTEELAASVKASAQASRQAASIAGEAMQAAQSGGAIAGDAVAAMARIESASQKISDIIRVIDDIAFQTNLLALNAAVEAARAGDAGKGFAVVASEVRTLAQRSSDAAKDISALISSSNSEVGEGVKLVRQAGEQLSQILASSRKVAATIADISAASGEQANGIDEMSQAVAHLDEMTQQNAALSEQSAASAASLSSRIGQLNDLVAAFRTGQEGAGAPAAYRPPAPTASEPARLRQLAEAAFVQTRAQAPQLSTPKAQPSASAPRPAARKVANGRANDAGWEEF